MSADILGAREREEWRAPFSGEGFVDVRQRPCMPAVRIGRTAADMEMSTLYLRRQACRLFAQLPPQIVAGTAGSTNSRRSRGAHRRLGAWVDAPGFQSFLFYLNYTEPGKRRRAPCSIRRQAFSSKAFFGKVFG